MTTLTENPVEVQPAAAPIRLLSQEERNDLRKKVLRGEQLSVEEARAVFETLRSAQGGVVITGETSRKGKRQKKEGMSDAALDASLDGKLAGL